MTDRKEDSMKILLKSCTNFIKMNKDEKSEGIKINYWMGLESKIVSLKIDNDTTIKIIFEEILKKQTSILKSKHLLYAIIAFLKKKNPPMFIPSFFEVLMIFSQEYDENQQYFNEYLIDLSLKMFVELFQGEEKEEDEERRKLCFHFFTFLSEKDIEAFVIRFNCYYLDEGFRQRLFDHGAYVKLLMMIIGRLGTAGLWNIMQSLIGMIQPEMKDFASGSLSTSVIAVKNKKMFYKELIMILNDAMGRNIGKAAMRSIILQLVFYTVQLTKSVTEDIEGYDQFLLNGIEMVISTNTFHYELLKELNDLYHSPLGNIRLFKRIFPCVLYYMSDLCYSSDHIDFYINCLPTLSPLYQRIILKKINVMQMIPIDSIKLTDLSLLIPQEADKEESTSPSKAFFDFPIDNSIKALKHLSNLTLLDYLLNSCISCPSQSTSVSVSASAIIFNQRKFTQILQCYLTLTIKTSNAPLHQSISQFLIFLLSSLIDLCLHSKQLLSKSLTLSIFSIIKSSNLDYQTESIYPIIIQIMRSALIPNYALFSYKSRNDIIEHFFTYLLTFARNDNIALLTSRLLVILFNSPTLQGNEHKVFCYEVLVELCFIANNAKIFLFFFDFAKENIIKTDTKHISLCAINDYASKYEGALQSGLRDYVMNSFQQIYDKSIDLMQLDSDMLFATSTMVKLFQKDKQEPMMILLKQYFTRNTFIDVIEKICLVIKQNEPQCSLNEIGLSHDSTEEKGDMIQRTKMIQENMKALDYHGYIDGKYLKGISCYYAILKQISILFSELLSFYINEENESNQASDQKQSSPMYNTIVKYFNFLWEKIANNSTKDISNLIILNEILSNETNYNFFYITHSNLLANTQIKDTNSDYSHLEELTIQSINHKHKALLSSIIVNRGRIFLLTDAFKIIMSKEIKMIILNSKQTAKSVMLYNTIWSNSLFNSIGEIGGEEKKEEHESSFFILEFIALMFSLKDIETNQVLFAFFLENRIFVKYFKQLAHLINFDIVLLEYYSIIREKECGREFIRNFIDFLTVYVPSSKQVQQFVLRLLSNYAIYTSLYNKLGKSASDSQSDGDRDDKEDFYKVILVLFENLIKYNSYQPETKETLNCIIINMQRNIKENCVYPRKALEFYAEFLLKLYTVVIVGKDKKEGDASSYEINPKLKGLLREQLITSLLPGLIEELYKEIQSEFDGSKSNKNQYQEREIAYLYKTLDYIINFKTTKVISDLNKNITDEHIINCLDRFSQCNHSIISNVQLNNLSNEYINDLTNNSLMLGEFTKYFLLYRSINLKQEDKLKVIKDQIIILLEPNDNKNNEEHISKIAYALLLCALYQNDQKISGVIFNDQFDIYEEIGEIMSNEIINSILN